MRRFLLAVVLGLSAAACKYTCEELKSKFAEELAEVRKKCGCEFTITCDPAFDGGPGVEALTVKGPGGTAVITMKGGGDKFPKKTLRHELVHAVDKCLDLCESAFPITPAPPGAPVTLIERYRQKLFCEYIAYRIVEDWVVENLPEDRFPEADDDDRAIDSAYRSVGSQLTGLTAEEADALREVLREAGLAPEQVRADNPTYMAMKRRFREELARIRARLEDCFDLINDL